MSTYGGMICVPSIHAVQRVEDWSRVRSPSRARRRLKQGHRQNITTKEQPCAYEIGGMLFIHPRLYADLRRTADQWPNHFEAESA